jgi:hypothetical protein
MAVRPRLRIPATISHARPAAPYVARALATGVTGGLLLYGGTNLVRAWGKRNDGTPLDHDLAVSGEGTLVRTPDGGLVYLPSDKYLANLKDLGYNYGADDAKGIVPVVLDEPATAEQSSDEDKHKATLDAFTNPMTLLIVGGIIIAAIVITRKA